MDSLSTFTVRANASRSNSREVRTTNKLNRSTTAHVPSFWGLRATESFEYATRVSAESTSKLGCGRLSELTHSSPSPERRGGQGVRTKGEGVRGVRTGTESGAQGERIDFG